jgi:hypothetical protein
MFKTSYPARLRSRMLPFWKLETLLIGLTNVYLLYNKKLAQI